MFCFAFCQKRPLLIQSNNCFQYRDVLPMQAPHAHQSMLLSCLYIVQLCSEDSLSFVCNWWTSRGHASFSLLLPQICNRRPVVPWSAIPALVFWWRKNGLAWMGLVRITSWYPNFNGSHIGLPPSSISTEWLDCHPKSCELWRIRTGPIHLQKCSMVMKLNGNMINGRFSNCFSPIFSFASLVSHELVVGSQMQTRRATGNGTGHQWQARVRGCCLD